MAVTLILLKYKQTNVMSLFRIIQCLPISLKGKQNTQIFLYWLWSTYMIWVPLITFEISTPTTLSVLPPSTIMTILQCIKQSRPIPNTWSFFFFSSFLLLSFLLNPILWVFFNLCGNESLTYSCILHFKSTHAAIYLWPVLRL